MFKSKSEFASALLYGRRFELKSGNICYYDETLNPPFRIKSKNFSSNVAMKDSWEEFSSVKEVLPWYKKQIQSQGVLCWLWDERDYDRSLGIVIEYDDTESYPFITSYGQNWRNAKPVTENEMLEIILKSD